MNTQPITTQHNTLAQDPQGLERAQLREAAKQFESLFVNMLMKSMRNTVIESDLIENKGEINTYRSLLDEEMSKQMASGPNGLGIAEMIVRSFDAPTKTQDGLKADESPSYQPVPEATRQRALRAYGSSQPISPVEAAPAMTPSLMDRAQRLNPAAADTVSSYGGMIEAAAQKTGLDEELILAVIMSESSGEAKAESHAGAQGLMQLMPATAQGLGVEDAFDPAQNIDGGSRYLATLKKRFEGDMELMLAGYNAGPGRVRDAGGQVPDIAETKGYVQKVTDLYHQLTEPTTKEAGTE